MSAVETQTAKKIAAKKMGVRRINCGRGHRYTIDGKSVTGVTTLIKGGRPNNALIGWAAKEVAQHVADNLDTVYAMKELGRDAIIAALRTVPNTVRNDAGMRGTKLHALAERLAMGEEVEYPDEMEGYVLGYVEFLDSWQVKPILVEATIGSRKWAYGGTTDLVADVITPKPITLDQAPWLDEPIPAGTPLRVIFDPKTSRSGVFPDAAYQLAAYRYAEIYLDADGNEQPMADLGIQMGAVVHCRSDGTEVVPVNAGPETFDTFTRLASVARRVKDDDVLIGKPVYSN